MPIAPLNESSQPAADEFDADSVISEPGSAGLTSLRSSAFRMRFENGRQYSCMSENKYWLPSDDTQCDRMQAQHMAHLITLNGRLCLCPKEEGTAKRVLDLGTGSGTWAIDYADAHPEAEVIGVDLSPMQPSLVPPNCSFEIDDIEKEWLWPYRFDFIFMRTVGSCLSDYEGVVQKAYDNLEPGGWLEIQEIDLRYFSDDNTLPADSSLVRWAELLRSALHKTGPHIRTGEELESMVRKAGFPDVVHHSYRWPINGWPLDKHYKELGQWVHYNATMDLEGICLSLFTRILGWSKEETLVFCSSVRKEFGDRSIHAYAPCHVLYAQKPLT